MTVKMWTMVILITTLASPFCCTASENENQGISLKDSLEGTSTVEHNSRVVPAGLRFMESLTFYPKRMDPLYKQHETGPTLLDCSRDGDCCAGRPAW